MKYHTKKKTGLLSLFILLSIASQCVFTEPSVNGQISQQISRTNSQSVNKNISDRMVRNKRVHARFHTKGQIKEVQQMLHDLGYKPGKVDGLMGKKTRKAIRDFQKSHKLKSDGLLTQHLFQKLHDSSSNK